MSKDQQSSFSTAQVKGIDYFSEEWVKQLIETITSDKAELLRPFVGCISYPSRLFPSVASNTPTLQFSQTTYVGLMDMVFPPAAVALDVDGLPGFTVVQFTLDGLKRTFISIAGGDITSGALAFKDYVASLYPDANNPIPFNQAAIHVLRNISIQGSKFTNPGDGTFDAVGFLSGAHTVGYQFCIAVSGYDVRIQ